MSRAELQARVDALRAELKAAERDLVAAYGSGVEDLARLFLGMFQESELRRAVRYRFHALDSEIPPNLSPNDLCHTVARLLAGAGVGAATLRAWMIADRPRRQQDIDHALASWGGQ